LGSFAEVNTRPVEDQHLAADLLGYELWAAAISLCKFLTVRPAVVNDKHVLELGAGVGLPGLLASKLGASRVMLTDHESGVRGYLEAVDHASRC
jgi:predicted nicotinamide N-methyase